MPLKISVDCDRTFVRTDIDWFHYLCDLTGVYNHGITIPSQTKKYSYDLTSYFKKELEELAMTGFEFWDNPYLYDNSHPISGAVQCLENLYFKGHDITFVSHVIGGHAQSKIDFISYFCPFVSDIIITEDKHEVPCDIIIEDRVQNLKDFTASTVGIILDNEYVEHYNYDCPYSVVPDWSKVEERVEWLNKNYF